MPAVHSKEAGPAAKRQKTSGVRLHEGHEHAWYRTVSDDGSSSPARADTPGRKKDTRVHRLLRHGAFRRDESNERMISENRVLAAYLNRLSDKTVRDQIDNSHRATAMLEQYTLKHVATGKFRDMLVAIEKLFDDDGHLIETDRSKYPQYEPPEDILIEAFVEHLRAKPPEDDELTANDVIAGEEDDDDEDDDPDGVVATPPGRGCTSKSIETYLGGLSTTSQMVGHAKSYIQQFSGKLNTWATEDEQKQAPSYDPVADGIKMYDTVMHGKNGWTAPKKIAVWTRYLAHCNMIGRVSDASMFCPVFEDIELPPADKWKGGVPPYVTIVLRNWKWKNSKNRHSRNIAGLKFTIDRNTLDHRFCFCHWYITYCYLRDRFGYEEKGKLFDFAGTTGSLDNSRSWARCIKKIFTDTAKEHRDHAHLAKCTSHSIRRTMAQHARLSGYRMEEIMEIGRWHDTPCLKRYLDEANLKEQERVDNAKRLNVSYTPLFMKHWVFSTKCYVIH